MKKRILVLLMICSVAIFLVACNSEKSKIEEIQEIFGDIHTNYVELQRMLFGGDVAVGEELKDENGFPYFYIKEEKYKEVEHIEALMENIFSENYINQHFQWVLYGETPLYREINGKLCIAMEDASGGSIPHEISELLIMEESNIVFVTQNEIEKSKISLVFNNEKWLIDKIEEMDE